MDQHATWPAWIARVGLGSSLVLALVALPCSSPAQPAASPSSPATDIGWPRQVADGASTITIYQPQLDRWDGDSLTGRAAVSVASQASPTPTFGVVWFSARTEVDRASRIVTLQDLKITRSSFPTEPDQANAYVHAIENGFPAGARTIALDRLETNLAVTQAQEGSGGTVQVKNQPPRIIFSDQPAILVLVDGQPALRQADDSGKLVRVINTRALILLDQLSGPGRLLAEVRQRELERRERQAASAGSGAERRRGAGARGQGPGPGADRRWHASARESLPGRSRERRSLVPRSRLAGAADGRPALGLVLTSSRGRRLRRRGLRS